MVSANNAQTALQLPAGKMPVPITCSMSRAAGQSLETPFSQREEVPTPPGEKTAGRGFAWTKDPALENPGESANDIVPSNSNDNTPSDNPNLSNEKTAPDGSVPTVSAQQPQTPEEPVSQSDGLNAKKCPVPSPLTNRPELKKP